MSAARISQWSKCFAGIAAGLVALTGMAVLLGWALDIAVLKGIWPGLPLMVPNTAIAFVLAGLALWLLNAEPLGTLRQRTAQVVGCIVMLIGALTLSEYLFNWRLGIDQLLFRERVIALGTPVAGRPALLAAVNFLFLSLAVLLFDAKRVSGWLVELLIVIPVLVSLLALIGYAYKVPSFYGWNSLFPNTAMALHTTAAFTILGSGLLCARPSRSLMKVIASATPGGVVARRLLLAPVIIPLLTGLIRVAGQQAGFYNAEFAGWLFSFLNIFVFTAVIWWIATLLYRADEVRQRAEEEVRQLNSELEQRVAGRTAALAQTAKDLEVEITERKTAEEALRKSEAQLQTIVENLGEGVAVSDLEGQLLHFNRAALDMHGFANLDECRRRLPEFADTFELQRMDGTIMPVEQWPLARILRGEKLRDLEVRIRRLQSDWQRIFSYGGTLVRDAGGQPMMAIITISDITERKGAETALKESEARLRQIIDLVPIYIFAKDCDGRFLLANRMIAEAFGKTPAEVEGKTQFELAPNEIEARRFLQADREVIESGKPKFIPQETFTGPQGAIHILQTTKIPFTAPGTHELAVLGASVDITDLKRAEQEIHELNVMLEKRVVERTAELEAANKELEAFSYSVSHDLRAPLRHVQGYVEMLTTATDGQLSDKARRYLKTITDASVEMGQLIDDLLAFSRMGRAEMSQSRVRLDGLAQEAIRGLEMATKDRNIVWKIAPLPQVFGDVSMLKQVFANLIGNAVKFSRGRDPAEIEIGCAGEEDGRTIFFVRDNGAGFEMQYAHKLFGVFQRLHRAEEFEGTGIGLATARRIIARHGGRTWAEGALNQGATFYFTLKPATTL